MLTYADLMDHVAAYSGDDASATGTSKVRRAIMAAYAAVAGRNSWSYLWTVGRVVTTGPYGTGTVAYDHTGGAAERQLTLSGGTWPDWAAYAAVTIADVPYVVDRRVSDTVLTLTAAANPGADVAAGTAYSLRRDTYPLPADFVAGDETVVNAIGTVLEYVHPREWASQRRQSIGPSQPRGFSYIGDPARLGSMKIVFTPPPDAEYFVDFLYRRRPRPLFYDTHSTGTVSVAAAGTTETGDGTAFTARMVGSRIRFAADNQAPPSGEGGGNPCLYERQVTAFTSSTSIEIDEATGEDLTGVKFVVTDPVDIDFDGMTEYFLRECENQWRIIARSVVAKLNEKVDYDLAFTRALENDGKQTSRAAVLRRQSRRSGFLHYPLDFGV